MPESTFTPEQRKLILRFAAEEGDRPACDAFFVNEATLRSWRHRAERKVTDLRDRDDSGGVHNSAGAARDGSQELTDVQVETDSWDGALGCYRNVVARARICEKFRIGNQLVSQGERRTLDVPSDRGAPGLPLTGWRPQRSCV